MKCIRFREVPALSEAEKGCIELLEQKVFGPLRAVMALGGVREEDRLLLRTVIRARFGWSLETVLWLEPYLCELEPARGEGFGLEDSNSVDVVALARTVLRRTRLRLGVASEEKSGRAGRHGHAARPLADRDDRLPEVARSRTTPAFGAPPEFLARDRGFWSVRIAR